MGADVNRNDCKGNISLHHASRYENKNIIEYLVDHGEESIGKTKIKIPHLMIVCHI